MQKLRLALIQFAASADKLENLTKAVNLVKEAAKNKAQLVVLPECCNSPYGNQFFAEYSEEIPNGQSCISFAKAASDNKLFLIAGSIPEKFEGKLYNTTPVFGPDGKFITLHRKVHLFDIDVPGKMTFQESKTLSPGNLLTSFITPFCKIGLGICYDMRFAEMAQIYSKQGCNLLVYPGAFNLTTGPAHWELLARGRALDNQVYVAACGPARDTTASYVAWGHSTVVNPWGEIISTTDEKESIIYADLDFEYLQEVRKMIPIIQQKRKKYRLRLCVDTAALRSWIVH